MPHIDTLVPKIHAFPNLMGQRPLTSFSDYQKAIKVDLIKHDDPVAMMKGTFGFVKATWSRDGQEAERATQEEMEDALEQMLSGKALGLGLETVNFMFRISGITRIDTHQIVRQRIGVTFSQQCSGDQFWTHQNCLVEPSIALGDIYFYDEFIESVVKAKRTYQSMVDSDEISIQAARGILPQCLETFIFMNVNLATLLFFHQKRIDDGSQTWQINNIAQQMADRVTEVFPSLKVVFEKNKSRFKFQKEASADRANSFSTGLYIPKVDEFDYHNRDFLYDKTKEQMHLVGPHTSKAVFDPRYFWGLDEVTRNEYKFIKAQYDRANESVHGLNMSNTEIRQFNTQITRATDLALSKK